MAVQQHLDDEEKKKTYETKQMVDSPIDCAEPTVRRSLCSGEGNQSGGLQSIINYNLYPD